MKKMYLIVLKFRYFFHYIKNIENNELKSKSLLKPENLILLIIVFFVFMPALINHCFSQTTIWEEDFEGLAIGDQQGSGTPPKWTISPTTGYSGYFNTEKVSSNLFVEGNNMNQEGILTTESIDISSYSYISLTVEVSEVGTSETGDYIRVFYILDSGAETEFTNNGDNNGNFTNAVATTTGLSGNHVVIRIKVLNSAAEEKHRIKDILVQGTPTDLTALNEFRSRETGNWNNSETWEQKYIDNSWVNTVNFPVAQSSEEVIASIREGHTVSVTADVSIDDVTIDAGGAVNINSGAILTVKDGAGTDLTIKSTSETATGSLIVNGIISCSGTTNIERYIPSNNWHIISSPVSEQDISDFAVAYANEYTSNDYDLSPYNVGGDKWDPYTSSYTSGNLEIGKGYVLRRKTTLTTVNFTGNINQGIIPSTGTIAISDAGFGWNCLGNPYTSSISAGSFLTAYSEQLNPTYAGIYLWDGSATSPDYKVITNDENLDFPDGDGGYLGELTQGIAPGQGFIIRAKSGGGEIAFSPSMQFHASTNNPAPFKSNEISTPAIRLTVKAGEMINQTIVSFNSKMTNGLDPGYDAGKLKGNPVLALYTKLVDGSRSDVDFAVQALPGFSTEEVRIPVGLDFPEGGEISFSLETSVGFNSFTEVYIEDIQTQTLTRLNKEDAKYTTTVAEGIKGTGRFILVVSKNTATAIDRQGFIENNFTVFTRDKNITINGPATTSTRFAVYSVDGKIWFNARAERLNQNTIDGSHLPAGFYILKIQNSGQKEKGIKFVMQ